MGKEVVLNLGNAPEELERINQAVESMAEEEGWPSELVFQITLVLEELEMNIIQHAYTGARSAASQITLNSEADKLTIEIVDEGPPFNPLEDAPEPDLDASLEARQVGGLGVHLVRSLMDELNYSRDGDKNRLTLVKLRKA